MPGKGERFLKTLWDRHLLHSVCLSDPGALDSATLVDTFVLIAPGLYLTVTAVNADGRQHAAAKYWDA